MRRRTTCIEVHDGDTFLTSKGIWIRLSGVDCPELGKWGGKKATTILSKLILGKTITYQPVGRSYHRVLANVWVHGRSVNNYMRHMGCA